MSEMIRRALIAGSKAAQADSYVQKSDDEILALLAAPEGQRALEAMRAALSAALDPEDEALVEVHAMRGVANACKAAPEGSSLRDLLFSQRKAIAREVIAALKSSCASDQAQDVQSCPPQEQAAQDSQPQE